MKKAMMTACCVVLLVPSGQVLAGGDAQSGMASKEWRQLLAAGEKRTAPEASVNESTRKCTERTVDVYGTCTKEVCNAVGPNGKQECRTISYSCKTGTRTVCD